MKTMNHATRAYENASVQRSQRAQEADIFHRAIGALRMAGTGTPIDRVRALADNRRLWTSVADLMLDPSSTLPAPLRAQIVSVGLSVQREMDNDEPNFGFLISINENIAAGLTDGR